MAILGDAGRVRPLDRPTYTFLRTIAEGNTAETWLYRHDVFDRLVVQKSISLLGVRDALATTEPRILEELEHPHVIRIREAQWDADQPSALRVLTFTSDYYEGESVNAALADGHVFSTEDALSVIGGTLEALHYLGVRARIVHRDIKPGNIMLDGTRTVAYLGDFGSAARMEPDGTVEPLAGTVLYHSPEHAAGPLDARSDLYGAGMTLFEMLNGAFPYDELDRDVLEDRVTAGKPALTARYLQLLPSIHPDVARFTRKLMHPDRDRRFQSAAAALRALQRLTFVSWTRVDERTWEGSWPPRQPASRQRRLRITVEPTRNGREWKLSARSKLPGRDWRGYASLARRVPAGDTAGLSSFFRAVEAAAQTSPAW